MTKQELEQGIASLKQKYGFPQEKPGVEEDNHGWFDDQRYAIKRFLGPDNRLVLELGSWLGKSTRFICDHAPNAHVIAVDHWLGSDVHQEDPRVVEKLSKLYETFLVNCWDYRERITPLRMDSLKGMDVLASYGLKPDLIFVDASHHYADVLKDLHKCLEFFPGALVCGDDWKHSGDNHGVRRAVKEIAAEKKLQIFHKDNFWALRSGRLQKLGDILATAI